MHNASHLTHPWLRHRGRLLVAAVAALLTCVATVAFGLYPGSAAHAAVPAPPSGWSTAFSDDFNGAAGSGLDTANWLYDTGTGYAGGAGNWGTGEVETVTNSTSNVYQDGSGHLVIKPIRDSSGHWTSGRVETQRTDFEAPAGGQMEIAASIKQPNPAVGNGYWPAFWALGAAARPVGATNWPSIGELDIMEDVNGLSQHSATLHCGVDPGGPCNETTGISSGLQGCSGCQTGYHTYSVTVDRTNTSAEQLRFALDGTTTFTVNESQVGASTWQAAIDHGFFPILNVAMGGAYPNAICGCTSPAANTTSGAGMSVDYVAVYETGGGTTAPPTTAPPTTAPPTNPPAGSCPTAATSDFSADCDSGSQGAAAAIATSDAAPSGVDGNEVPKLANGDYLEYKGVNFGSGSSQFHARVASGASSGVSGLVEVVLDSPSGTPVGSFAVGNTGGWESWKTVPANISTVTGTHDVYLKFVSAATGNPPFVSLHYFSFPAH